MMHNTKIMIHEIFDCKFDDSNYLHSGFMGGDSMPEMVTGKPDLGQNFQNINFIMGTISEILKERKRNTKKP